MMAPDTRVAILGAGRGSAELLDFLLETIPSDRLTVLDDRWPDGPREVAGVAVTGTLGDASGFIESGMVVLGIANSSQPDLRLAIFNRLLIPDGSWLTYVHPASNVSARAGVGAGTVIYPGARVGLNAEIGRACAIYYNSVVHHDARIGDGAVLSAGVLIAGNVEIGEGAYLGIGAVVRDGISIGARSLVGMGAVVTRDVEPGTIVAGLPARRVR